MKQIGKYQIIDFLGSGAYAEVYKAEDTALHRTVALKLLKPALLADDDAVARFMKEAQTAANLIHPQIAWVWDVGNLEGRYYIAMRFIDGKPLDQVLLHQVFSEFRKIITVEDAAIMGGFGSAIAEFMIDNGYQANILRLGVPDRFIEHGEQKELYQECGFDAPAIMEAVRQFVKSPRSLFV